jgi:hypothetical protein
MFCIVYLSLFVFCSCTDESAYNSCRNTLTTATQEISKAATLSDAELIDKQINDTLYKYGHSKMTKEMIDEIKHLKSTYEKHKEERLQFLKDNDTIPARKIIEMPGIGLVEVHTPPEV